MEVLIPPWVRPESPETIRIVDDATVAFQPAFGRGMTQRGIFADPRWGLRRRYRGLRSDEKAAILNALNESRGQLNVIRVTPHTPIRGSFATNEILTNNTFASGTTGWTSGTDWSISVSDRVLRSRRIAVTASDFVLKTSGTVTLVQYAPYALRYLIQQGRGSLATGHLPTYQGVASLAAFSTSFGYTVGSAVRSETSVTPTITVGDASGMMPGDYVTVPYISLARCALIDNGPNLLLWSEDLTDVSWTKTRTSATGNSVNGPDGTTSADFLKEDSSNNTHFAIQGSVTVSSSAADYAFCVPVRAAGRNFCVVGISEATGGTGCEQYFNITSGAGAVGANGTTGANWSNRRAFVVDMGGGWYLCCVVGRKTNAATSLSAYVYIATTDGTNSYTGNNTDGICLWRATLAQSSVPVRPIKTQSTNTSGTTQSGAGIYTKGWPASASGLLLTGDWSEINGELKQLTAPVNSDAAGLAYMQFRPGLAGAPADNDPIIVYEPFGRFIYPAGTREFENLFGIYGDCEMNLEEIYS